MRIRAGAVLIEENTRPYKLKDCSLVIDAHNFFYDCYKQSNLHFEFGAECDRYAKYLKNYLSMFKNANIKKCYFIFKGGTKELENKIYKSQNEVYNPTQDINPIFMVDIHVEVLKEMEFDYFFSEYESKDDCMTLARKLSCPVISEDIEFPLSGVNYVPKNSLSFDKDHIRCKLISQNDILRRYGLNHNKLGFFILLTNEHIFPENSFQTLFRFRGIPLKPAHSRNNRLLQWLSGSSEKEVLKDILTNSESGKERILEELNKVNKIVRGEVNSQEAVDYFYNRDVKKNWFVTGVAANHIAKEYIDLYRCKKFYKRIGIAVDYMELSLNIIKYAYDLLTDFENEGLKYIRIYMGSTKVETSMITKSVKKPSCETNETILQNGWDSIRSLGLFQHFISETIQFDCDKLKMVPDEAKMLMLTLVYIFHNSKLQSNITTFTTEMAYGVLLSYVMLGVVQEHVDGVQKDNSVRTSDCETALYSLRDYFNIKDVNEMMDEKLLVSLKQFQFCFLHMNYLNKLCGSPFEPTSYRKTYNGTFVHKVIYIMQSEGIIQFVNKILSSAPTVLTCYYNIIEIYKNLIQSN